MLTIEILGWNSSGRMEEAGGRSGVGRGSSVVSRHMANQCEKGG